MPTGYIPARKNPVKNLNISIADTSTFGINRPKLNIPAKMALLKNTIDGEKRSEIVKIANDNVPMINPNWMKLVKLPKKNVSSCKLGEIWFITALPANQSEVQKN